MEPDATRDGNPTWAVLTNPLGAIALIALVDGVDFVLPLEVQVGGPVIAIDLMGSAFFGDLEGGAASFGLRIMPEAEGLQGFYFVPRVGGGTLGGAAGSVEIGYAWFSDGWVFNLGAGILYSEGAALQGGVGPMLNLSLGGGG